MIGSSPAGITVAIVLRLVHQIVALFSYDKWFNEGKHIVKGVPEEIRQTVYRGWMMKPELQNPLLRQNENEKTSLWQKYHIADIIIM